MLSEKQRYILDHDINSGIANTQHLGDMIDNTLSVVKGTYDFSKVGGAVGNFNLKDDDGVDVTLPSGALILNAFFYVPVACTSGGSATLAFASEGAGDLKAATAVASFSASAKVVGVPTIATLSTSVLLTADRKIVLSVAVAALTAGKVQCYVSYILTT